MLAATLLEGEVVVITKSIRLTEAEARDLREYLEFTGEIEAVALKRAALRGLREMRISEGLRAYLEERDSYAAAQIAGVPRAEFMHVLASHGISVLDEPSSLSVELESLARRSGDERLAATARQLG